MRKEMLYSAVLKLTDEDAERVRLYCEEHNLILTKRRIENKITPNHYVVWGDKKELGDFQKYF